MNDEEQGSNIPSTSDPARPLNAAAQNGDLEAVNSLLKDSSQDNDCTTAFLTAIYLGHMDIASALLAHAPQVLECSGEVAEGVVRELQASELPTFEPGRALATAIYFGHVSIAAGLQNNPPENSDDARTIAIEVASWMVNVVKPPILDPANAFILAATNGHAEVVHYLRDKNPSEALDYVKAFVIATYLGHEDVANTLRNDDLIIAGAAVASQVVPELLAVEPKILDPADALIKAVINGHSTVVTHLLNNPSDTFDWTQAFVIAIYLGHMEIVTTLLNRAENALEDGAQGIIEDAWTQAEEVIPDILAITPSVLDRDRALVTAIYLSHQGLVDNLCSDENPSQIPQPSGELMVSVVNELLTIKLTNGPIILNYPDALIPAVRNGHMEVVDYLLNNAEPLDCARAFVNAIYLGHTNIANRLLNYQPAVREVASAIVVQEVNALSELDIDPAKIFVIAAYLGHTDVINTLVLTPEIHEKARTLAAEVVNSLLEVTPEILNHTHAFSRAIGRNHPQVVTSLLANQEQTVDRAAALKDAAYLGRLNIVNILLESEPQTLERTEAFVIALYLGRTEITARLLNGAPENIHERAKGIALVVVNRLFNRPGILNAANALTVAAKNDHTEVVIHLLANQAQTLDRTNALKASARGGHLETVKKLLENVDQPPWTEILIAAAGGGHVEMVKEFLPNIPEPPWTAMFVAAVGSGHLKTVKEFLPNIPEPPWAAMLIAAAGSGRLEMVKEFLPNIPEPPWAAMLVAAAGSGRLEMVKEFLPNTPEHPWTAMLVAAAGGGHVEMVNLLLNIAPPPPLDRAPALEKAAFRGHLIVVNKLLDGAPQTLDRTEAFFIALYFGRKNIATTLLNGAPEIRERARRGALPLIDKWLNKIPRVLSVANALIVAADNGHLEVVTYLLANHATLDRTNALAAAARAGHLEIVNTLLEGAPESLNRQPAFNAAVESGHAKMVNRLLIGAPQGIDRQGIRDHMFNYHSSNPDPVLQNEIEKMNVILRRPVTRFLAIPSEEEEKSAFEERRVWINQVMSLHPREDKEVMPPLSEAVQPWLLIKEEERRKEKTAKFSALDNPVTDALASFTAFVYMAEATSDFEKNEASYKERMWNLLDALIDKNHPMLSGADEQKDLPTVRMTDAEHAGLREMIFAQSTEALDACVDRLSNGFKRFERVIKYAKARHYQTIDAHADLLKKMFIDDTKDRIAAIKAAEIQLDGYQFPDTHQFRPDDHRAERRKNPNEQVEVRALLDVHMGPDYQMHNMPPTMRFDNYVQGAAQLANPEKYGSKSNEIIAQEMAKEAEEIIDELIKGESKPPALNALIESANATRRADGRRDLTPKDISLMTLKEYAVREHPLWKDIIQKVVPEPFDRITEKIKEWDRKVKDLGENIDNDEGYKANSELYYYQNEAIPEILEDMVQQYFGAKPFMEKFASERNIEASQCKWEPLGMNRRLLGANYFVVGDDRKEDGKTCLQIDAAQNVIHFVMIDTKELLAQLKELAKKDPTIKQEIVPGQKFHIKGKEGKINSIEYKGMAGSSSSQAIGAGGEPSAKRHKH